jgi:hypothetical protein
LQWVWNLNWSFMDLWANKVMSLVVILIIIDLTSLSIEH